MPWTDTIPEADGFYWTRHANGAMTVSEVMHGTDGERYVFEIGSTIGVREGCAEFWTPGLVAPRDG